MADDSDLEDILEIEEIINFNVSIPGRIIPDRNNLKCLGSEEIMSFLFFLHFPLCVMHCFALSSLFLLASDNSRNLTTAYCRFSLVFIRCVQKTYCRCKDPLNHSLPYF